jgi:hypothetical protein
MPARAIYLEPKQDFARYPVDAEVWRLVARAAVFDFAPIKASLDLDTVTTSGVLDGITLVSRPDGLVGNSITVAFDGDALFPTFGGLSEIGLATTILYRPGVTTLAELEALLLLSNNVLMTGTWTGTDTIDASDEFAATALTGGADAVVGTGATLTTYSGDGTSRPVWDRPLGIDGTISDAIHALTEIIDFNGVPYAIGNADMMDGGRTVILRSERRLDWQWFRLFTWTVKGGQKSWWLPTWRDDLPFVSKAANTITIDGDASDFAAWWPTQREHVQVLETDGTITRAKITAAVDNGNGTWTLTIGTTLASSSVLMVSWLERCRFEGDEFEITWGHDGFKLETEARVVQR